MSFSFNVRRKFGIFWLFSVVEFIVFIVFENDWRLGIVCIWLNVVKGLKVLCR